jgi:hypothetical protein
MSLTKLSLDRNNLINTVQGEFGKLHAGWGWENGKLSFTVNPCTKWWMMEMLGPGH